jgi:hypothetical protein
MKGVTMKDLNCLFHNRPSRFWVYFFLLFFLGCLLLVPRFSHAGEISLDELNKNPNLYKGQKVTIRGKLKLIGKNYFDPASKFVLEDASKKTVPVKPWLPLEIAPASPDRPVSPGQLPKIMSDYLGKEIKVTGRVRLNDRKNEHEVLPELVEEMNP